jgi:predicted RNA-binding protein YlxR (DUF448 family)
MGKKGHIPIRMCIGCRKKRKKEEMLRLARSTDGVMLVNGKKNLSGRGFYLCPDLSCLKMAQKKNSMSEIIGIDRSMVSFESSAFHPVEDLTKGRKRDGES